MLNTRSKTGSEDEKETASPGLITCVFRGYVQALQDEPKRHVYNNNNKAVGGGPETKGRVGVDQVDGMAQNGHRRK